MNNISHGECDVMIPSEQTRLIELFPIVLQKLIYDELRVGNRIVEIGNGFPAPPIGKYVRLAKLITTRPRASDEQIRFTARNYGSFCGEITDVQRVFFIIESTQTDEGAYPDMNAIRAEMEARQIAADADMRRSSRS